jgi:hypothetical protein
MEQRSDGVLGCWGVRPTIGGEPLWRVCLDPQVLVLARVPPKHVLNKRLPGNTQRITFTRRRRPQPWEISLGACRAAIPWVIPGSRLLQRSEGRTRYRLNLAGRTHTR